MKSVLNLRALLSSHITRDLFDYVVAPYLDLNCYMIHAACAGNLDDIKYLISIGVDARADDDYVLQAAADFGHLTVVKYLVSIGADIHADYDNSFRSAAISGHLEVVKYLVSIGADIHAKHDYVRTHAFRCCTNMDVIDYLYTLYHKEILDKERDKSKSYCAII